MALTTSDLLTNVKRRAQLPDDSGTLSDSDILAMASDELQNVVFPRLMALHEWHSAFSYLQTLSSTRTYRINPRTAGNSIVSVELLDGTDYRFIPFRHPLMQKTNDSENYAIFGNTIVVSDSVPSSGTLRIRALLRPSRLVSSGCTSISSVSDTNTFVVASATGFTTGQEVDIVWHTSPYEVRVYDTSITVTGTTIDLDTTDTGFSSIDSTYVNNRMCPAEQTDRVPLQDELHDYLAQRVAIRCMEARGFTQDMQNHLRKLADLEAAFDRLTAPRARGDFKAIAPEDFFLDRRV